MKRADVDPLGEVFTGVNADGTTTTYAVTELNTYIDANDAALDQYKFRIPCEPYRVEAWFKDGSIEQDRIDALLRQESIEYFKRPIVFILLPDGSPVLVDGRHRYALWCALGAPEMFGFVLPWEIGQPFVIEDFPQVPTEIVYADSHLAEIREMLKDDK